jgi:hypothetical protein
MIALVCAPTCWPQHSAAPLLPRGALRPPPPFARGRGGRPLPAGLDLAYDGEAYSTHAEEPAKAPKAWAAVQHYTRGIGKEFTEERKKSSLLAGQPRWQGLHSLLTPPWIYVFLAFLYYLANGGYSAEQ